MATKGHYLAGVDFPVYALGWTGDHQLAATGGGGAGRTGVKNKITLFDVDAPRQKCDKVAELELAKNEDASSTLAVHSERKELVLGINSDVDTMKAGTNANVRVYGYSENAVQPASTHTTIASSDPEIYQKITKYSKDGSKILVTSSKDQLSVLACPSYAKIVPDLHFDDEEMFDADFSEDGSMFLGASSQRIHIWQTEAATAAMSSSSGDEESQPEPFQVIQSPVLSKSLKCSFRAARFGRASTASRLFTIVNATPHAVSGGGRRGGKGGNRGIERKAFITTWDTTTWELLKTRTVSKKPVTSFDVSPDGRMLALGGADLSISIFDAETVRPLLSILAAHDFPSTCLRFSPTSSLLASGSADNTLRIISADAALHPQRHQGLQLALVTLLVLLIAVLIQIYAGDRVLEVARRHLHV